MRFIFLYPKILYQHKHCFCCNVYVRSDYVPFQNSEFSYRYKFDTAVKFSRYHRVIITLFNFMKHFGDRILPFPQVESIVIDSWYSMLRIHL